MGAPITAPRRSFAPLRPAAFALTLAFAGWLAMAAGGGSRTAYAAACQTSNTTFGFTSGEQCYVVPAGVSSLHIVAVGAAGGGTPNAPAGSNVLVGGSGGAGGQVSADLRVSPGQTLYIEVGGAGTAGGICPVGGGDCNGTTGTGSGGFNGGAPGGFTPAPASEVANLFAGGGGGATDVRTLAMGAGTCAAGSSASVGSRLLVAGGGGGGGNFGVGAGENGGDGGGAGRLATGGRDGGPGGAADGKGGGPGGANAGAGGAAGSGTTGGVAGSGGSGACAGGGGSGTSANSGGGGGGGFSGGGGGGGGATQLSAVPPLVSEGAGGGGGAGSAFVASAATCRSPSVTSAPGRAAQVVITASNPCPVAPPPGTTPSATPSSGVKGTPPQPPGSTGADTGTMAGGAFLLLSGGLFALSALIHGRRRGGAYPRSTSQK